MRMYSYKPEGVCATNMSFDIKDGKVTNMIVRSGCTGNLQGIMKLVEGMEATEVVARLKNIKCRNNTSCPDQMAIAIEQALNVPVEV